MKLSFTNAIFDDVYVTSDTATDYITTEPTEWVEDETVLWAKFNGNLIGGNIDEDVQEILNNIKGVRIKRKPKDSTLGWVTVREYEVNTMGDLTIAFTDNTATNNVLYEYAWVPVLKNGSEGDYKTTEVLSKFNYVFLADANEIYKFVGNVAYGDAVRVQKAGMFEPFGRKYPVYVTNAETNYEQGSLSAQLIGFNNNLEADKFVAQDIITEKKIVEAFLTNKRAKILKDFNGNSWLVMITGNPSVSYNASTGNKMMTINFDWSEIGDITNDDDVKNAGLVGGIL